MQKNRLGDVLVQRGRLSEEDLNRAVAVQQEKEMRLGEVLLQSGSVSKRDIAAEEVAVCPPDPGTEDMFINTPNYLPIDSVLRVHFRLMLTGGEIFVRSKVRHSVPGVGIGVEFIHISSEAERAIEQELTVCHPSGNLLDNASERRSLPTFPFGMALQ